MQTKIITGTGFLFSLFFLLSGTQLQAQTTTMVGTVYENDQAKTTFNTPEGTINVYLPDDMQSGDVITGMVVAQPKGRNEKEKSKNLRKLLKYSLMLPGSLPLTFLETDNNQRASAMPKFTVPEEGNLIITINSPGNKPFSSTEIPTMPVFTESFSQEPAYLLAKKIITNAEPIVLLKINTGNESPPVILRKFHSPTYSDITEEPYILNPSISSSGKAVYFLPENLNGMYNVNVQLMDGTLRRIDLLNIVAVQASIGKARLMKGETTRMELKVNGLQGCPYLPVELEIVNLSPSVIQLTNGNHQLFPVDQSDDPVGYITQLSYFSSQDVVGLTTGTYMVNTTLHIPPAAYTNAFYPYINQPATIQDFNMTMDGLKDDLDHLTRIPDLDPELIKSVKEIQGYLGEVETIKELQHAKSAAINLTNRLVTMSRTGELLNDLPALNQIHPDIARKASVTQYVHPLHNYAGEFYPDTKRLIINPDGKEALLRYLKAEKMSNGRYTITLSDGTNPVIFSDVELTSADLGIDNAELVSPGTGNQKDLELSEPLREKTEFTDKEGRKYIMYKNAQCKVMIPAELTECRPQYESVKNQKTGEYDLVPTGKYIKINDRECKKCVAGTEICVEMKMIWRTMEYYDDVNCNHLIRVETREDFLDP